VEDCEVGGVWVDAVVDWGDLGAGLDGQGKWLVLVLEVVGHDLLLVWCKDGL